MTSEAVTDAELVRKCQEGEWRAYNELVARHQDRLFNLIYRYVGNWEDARDLCQEVFVKAFRAIAQFRGDAQFGTWLHQIGVNTLISWRRSKQAHATASLQGSGDGASDEKAASDPVDKAPRPDEVAGQRERERLVQEAISALDDEQRILVVLRDIEGRNYEQIARALGCPRGTVKSRLHRARLTLRDRLRSLFADETERDRPAGRAGDSTAAAGAV